ncbi:MAG: SLC45 family MFS transporter [Tissierellia bacterium]|jgi:Na+/melibiose symporter-like transporter|nr:SLC45 family MFS transporter [Tissierellia bacterium]
MKLNVKRTIFVGLAFLSISSFWQMYDNLIPLVLQNTFNIGETWTGGIMALDNVLALFLLPLFGHLSDKLQTPLGRRTPFIVIGTIIAIVFMLLIPVAVRQVNFLFFFIALGGVLLALSFYRTPAVALMPDVTPKPLRSMANAIINLMGSIGGMLSLVFIMFLVPKVDNPDYSLVFYAVALVMAIAVIVLLTTIRENKLRIPEEKEDELTFEGDMDPPTRRSFRFLLASVFFWFLAYNAITTAFSRYAIRMWGFVGGGFASALIVAFAAAMVAFIPIGLIASKVGRKKTIMVGIGLIATSYAWGFFFQSFSPLIYGVFIMKGIGWAAINVNSFPMVVEMSRVRDIGKYTGLYYTASMSAQILTPILSGALLQYVSYRTLFPYAFFFAMIAMFTMSQVRHGDSKPTPKLEELVPDD